MDIRDIAYVIDAHTNHAKKPENTFRKWDGITPYSTHPIWCAVAVLHETSLPLEIRTNGSQVLLYHDVPEDTNAILPEWLSPRVKYLISQLTFDSSEHEWDELFNREKEVRLYKLFDKTSNIMDGIWMVPERREKHLKHLKKVGQDVKSNYGNLNIVRLAETFFKPSLQEENLVLKQDYLLSK